MKALELNNWLKEQLTKSTNRLIVPTGFKKLDHEIKGFHLGELVFLGAWNMIWSQQFLVQMSMQMAKDNSVCFMALDDNDERMAKRVSNIIMNNSFLKFNHKNTTEELNTISEETQNMRLIFECNPSDTYSKLIDKLTKLIQIYNIQFFVLDRADLILTKKQWFKLSKFTREWNICIICSYPLPIKKYINTKKCCTPDLSVFKYLNPNPIAFDKILFLHKDEYFGIIDDSMNSKRPFIEFIVEKNRTGKYGFHLILQQDKNLNIIID